MRQSLLAALAVTGALALGADEPAPGLLASELTYFLPICSPRLSPGTFCIEVPDLAALRPPHIPLEVWQLIIAR